MYGNGRLEDLMLRYIDVPISLILRIQRPWVLGVVCIMNLLTYKDTIDRYGYLVFIVDIYLHSIKMEVEVERGVDGLRAGQYIRYCCSRRSRKAEEKTTWFA